MPACSEDFQLRVVGLVVPLHCWRGFFGTALVATSRTRIRCVEGPAVRVAPTPRAGRHVGPPPRKGLLGVEPGVGAGKLPPTGTTDSGARRAAPLARSSPEGHLGGYGIVLGAGATGAGVLRPGDPQLVAKPRWASSVAPGSASRKASAFATSRYRASSAAGRRLTCSSSARPASACPPGAN